MKVKNKIGFTGQELVEYAITLPLFLLMVMGIFDLGRAVYYYSVMNNSAREGARYGSIHLEQAGVETIICNRVVDRSVGLNLNCNDVTTTFDFVAGNVQVSISYEFVPVSGIITSLFGVATVPISTSSIMQLEYVPLP
jgi:hypothetical protein